MAKPTPLITAGTAPVRRGAELPEQMLTVVEVAAIMRVCRATVYRMVSEGTLRAVHVVNSIRIPPSALDEIGVAPVRATPTALLPSFDESPDDRRS